METIKIGQVFDLNLSKAYTCSRGDSWDTSVGHIRQGSKYFSLSIGKVENSADPNDAKIEISVPNLKQQLQSWTEFNPNQDAVLLINRCVNDGTWDYCQTEDWQTEYLIPSGYAI